MSTKSTRTRKSEIAKQLNATPEKRRSARICHKENSGKASSLRTKKAPVYSCVPDSSSSSSSDEDDEDGVVKEEDLNQSDVEEMEVDEKENRRRTRSQSLCRRNQETPSKKLTKDLEEKCTFRTPTRNLSKQQSRENTTPRKNHRASVAPKQVFSISDDDISDELGDEEVTELIHRNR